MRLGSRISAAGRLLLLAGLAPLAAGCSDREQRLTIAFSNDMVGEIRSCGCAAQDYGGLGRRATFLHNTRKTADNFILLEGGDVFGTDVNYGREKARLTLQAMSYMGYDGIAVGEKDLSLGLDFLVERVNALKLPVLAANLFYGDTDSLVFSASRIVTTDGGLDVALIGLIDNTLPLPRQVAEGSVRVTDPQGALERELAALPPDVDLVFALGHMRTGSATRLAQSNPRLDAVVCGHDARPMRRVRRFGNAFVLQTSSKGRFMGVANALIDAEKKISEMDTQLQALTTDFADHEAIVKLFQAYDLEIANQERARVASGMPDAKLARNPFTGAQTCQPCHRTAYAKWEETKHAHAFEILEEQNRQFDRDCTPCHTTGFYEMGGFMSAVATPELIGVQCESCHGNGSAHSKNPAVKTATGSRTVCVSCHNADQTPDFSFAKYWPPISHASDPKPDGQTR